MPSYAEVEVGTALPERTFQVQRENLIRYAGASGDFNVIHWNERVAKSVGLPNVIAHGMYTMALTGRVVTDWVGDPSLVRSYGTRFTRPVVVPDDDTGALVEITGTVADVTESDGVRVARIDVKAVFDGKSVLGRATAEVVLPG
jgi:acyl dehydratase